MSEFDDTKVEEEQVVEETTPEDTSTETVEDFSDALDAAETEDEAIAAFNATLPEVEEEAEETIDSSIDTDTDQSVDDIDFSKGVTIKDGDLELTITDRDKAVRLMQQGLNYAGKTTELAKYRSFVNYAEENGISLDDIQMLHDIKGGNKDAYSKLAKDSGIDVYDVSEDQHEKYTPDPVELVTSSEPDPRVDSIAGDILANEDYTAQFQKWLPKMPEDVQQLVTSDADILSGVYKDIKAGVFDGSMNQAYQYMRVDGMPFGEAYTRAKAEFNTINEPAQERAPMSRGQRQRASSPRQGGGTSQRSGYAPGVITDMSDDEFMENYRDIINSVKR